MGSLMRAMYVSKRSDVNIPATVHREIIADIVGKENLIRIDLRQSVEPCAKANYIAYGKYPSKINRVKRWLEGNTMYMSNKIADELVDLIVSQKIDVVFIDESKLGVLVKRIKNRLPQTRVVCFYHDIGADLFVQWAKNGGLLSKIENHFNLRGERLSNEWSDDIAVFHECDRDKFLAAYGWAPRWIIPAPSLDYGIPEEYPEPQEGDPLTVMFLGSAGFSNISGVRWFCKEVLPLLIDDVRVEIVGRINLSLKLDVDDARLKQIGEVDSVEDYYRNVDVVIVPVFAGGGMKVKTGEALAYGKCLVGSSESLHGYWERMGSTIQGKMVFCSDEAAEWAEIINSLARQRPKRFYQELYDYSRRNFSSEALEADLRGFLIGDSNDAQSIDC